MKQLLVAPQAVADLQRFKSGNSKLVFKVLELITDIQQTPFAGLGKPEPLKGNYQGYWSRRINDEHRLIYRITEGTIEIVSCYGHYE